MSSVPLWLRGASVRVYGCLVGCLGRPGVISPVILFESWLHLREAMSEEGPPVGLFRIIEGGAKKHGE